MKTILWIYIGSFLSGILYAQDSTQLLKHKLSEGDYCASVKKGKTIVTNNGIPIDADVMLPSGTKITPQGLVIRKDGSEVVLKDGQCITRDDIIGPAGSPEKNTLRGDAGKPPRNK
jgi:hypothetical protein